MDSPFNFNLVRSAFGIHFLEAVRAGRYARVSRLLEMPPDEVAATIPEAVVIAAENGNLDMLQYLVEESPKRTGQKVDTSFGYYAALTRAAFNGHLSTVKYLVEESWKFTNIHVDLAVHEFTAVTDAASQGHLELLRYFTEDCKQYYNEPLDLSAMDNRTLCNAVYNRDMAVLKYLIEESWQHTGQKLDQTYNDNELLRTAIDKNALEIVQYLIEESWKHTGKHVSLSASSHHVHRIAVTTEHYDVLQYLLEQGAPLNYCLTAPDLSSEFFERMSTEVYGINVADYTELSAFVDDCMVVGFRTKTLRRILDACGDELTAEERRESLLSATLRLSADAGLLSMDTAVSQIRAVLTRAATRKDTTVRL